MICKKTLAAPVAAVVASLLSLVFCDVTSSPAVQKPTLADRLGDIQSTLGQLTRVITQLDKELELALSPCDVNNKSPLCQPTLRHLTSHSLTSHSMTSHKLRRRAAGLESQWIDDYKRKRILLNNILDIFQGADNALHSERKRSCYLNLGFHCNTKGYSNYAHISDFLRHGPGKRADGLVE